MTSYGLRDTEGRGKVRNAKYREILRDKARDSEKKLYRDISSHIAFSRVSVPLSMFSVEFRALRVPSHPILNASQIDR